MRMILLLSLCWFGVATATAGVDTAMESQCAANWSKLVSDWSAEVGGLDQPLDAVAERTARASMPFAKILLALGDEWHGRPPYPGRDDWTPFATGLLIHASDLVGEPCAHSTRWLEAVVWRQLGDVVAAWRGSPYEAAGRVNLPRTTLRLLAGRAADLAQREWRNAQDRTVLAKRTGLGSIWWLHRNFADPDHESIEAFGDRRPLDDGTCATTVVQMDLSGVEPYVQRTGLVALVSCERSTYEEFIEVIGDDDLVGDARLGEVASALRALLEQRVELRFEEDSLQAQARAITTDDILWVTLSGDEALVHVASPEFDEPLDILVDVSDLEKPVRVRAGNPPDPVLWGVEE